MIGVIRIGSTVQLRILRIAPCRRCQTVQSRTIGVMQRIRSIPDTRHSPLDIVGDAGNGLCGAGCSQLPQYQSPIYIITVTVDHIIHYTRNCLIFKSRLGIIGQSSRSGGVRNRYRLVQEIIGDGNRRRVIRITQPRHPPCRIIGIGRNNVTRPSAGQKLPIAVVGVGDRTVVRIGLGCHLPAIVVAPARHLRRVGVLEGLQRRLHAEAVVGVFHRVGRPVYPFHFTRRVIGRIGHDIARRRHFRLAPHRIVLEAGRLAVDRLRQHRPIGVIGHRHRVDRSPARRLLLLHHPVELIVSIGNQIAAGAVGVDLLHARRPAIQRIGDLLRPIRIGDRLTGHAIAEPLQLRMRGQTAFFRYLLSKCAQISGRYR